MNLNVAPLYDDTVIPTRKNLKDAGIDLYAYLADMSEYVVYPGDIVIFRTGITVEIPRGYFGWITNKSSKDYIIGGGIVDETYQGELLVKVINVTDKPVRFIHGSPLAQLLIIPCVTPEIKVISPLEIHKEKTSRGDSGGIKNQTEFLIKNGLVTSGMTL